MEQKIEKAKKYYYFEGQTTLADIKPFADAHIPGLLQSIAKEQLTVSGPMEFIYFGASSDVNNIFTLQIALPVIDIKAVEAPYQVKEVGPFDYVSFLLEGSMENLDAAYGNAFAEIGAKQLQPSGEIREVYHVYKDYTSADNRTEVQIGIKV